jgi:hypothetical protein
MTVIARDAVASDHLVYAWPFPIGPECEVACSEDEQVVMCPAWMVGDRLGPGRHRWRTPDPSRPVAAFFVLTAPVQVEFDLVTQFIIPNSGQPVRLRAVGSLQVRCADPGLLVAQFVGLPFDSVNEGVLRSVSRSIERMLARLLTRRVVMAQTPYAVIDPNMLAGIIEELIAYNPTAGAVFGVELIRIGRLAIAADDGSSPYLPQPQAQQNAWGNEHSHSQAQAHQYNGNQPNGHQHHEEPPAGPAPAGSPNQYARPRTPQLDTIRGMPAMTPDAPTDHAKPAPGPPQSAVSGEIGSGKKPERKTPMSTPPPIPAAAAATSRRAAPIDVPHTDEVTQPGIDSKLLTPVPGSVKAPAAAQPAQAEARGSILGIGMGSIGSAGTASGSAAGEIQKKIAPGGRVLVPGPNGLLQSATVKQLLQGYYELEVGGTGQTIWVPVNGVVPE